MYNPTTKTSASPLRRLRRPSYHSSSSSGSSTNKSNRSGRSNSLSKNRLSTRSSTSSSSPLASLVHKFDKFKKRMSSKKERLPRSYTDTNIGSKSNVINQNNVSKHKRSSVTKVLYKPIPERSNTQKEKNTVVDNRDDVKMDVDRGYDRMMDGMMKMTSSNSRDDATIATSSSTQPSYSHDDGSTIVSVDTNYSFHTFAAGKETFTVDRRYSMIRTVGSGAYGCVISAKDFHKRSNIAIKMIPRAFQDEIDAKRILREIKLLKHFRHENIISILDMMPPIATHVEDFNDVYIVTELMETDLHRIIYSKQSLSIDHVQYFLYQVLRALKYMHSANVLHRDLKPSNLLVNSNCDLKVCDFGLARGITTNHHEEHMDGNGGSMLLTEYVVTRWYRAPEIMLACNEYSKPSDMWSVGCIFAELLGRKPFFAGDDYIDQLTIISDKLGKIPEDELDFVTTEKAKRFMRKLPNTRPVPLSKKFPNANPEGIDLLKKMLKIHPRKRIDVVGALEHPFFSSLHNPNDEPVANAPFDFSFEDEKLHRVRLQELIWSEVSDFRPSCLPIPPRKDGTSFCKRLYHA